MKRFSIVTSGIVSIVGGFYSFYHFCLKPETSSIWLVFGPMIGLVLLGITLLVWGMSDNLHNVKAGTVIGHNFTRAHMTQSVYIPGSPAIGSSPGTPATYIPGYWVNDDWAINLRDSKGRTGWLHFSANVLDEYPIGSRYPQ